MTPDERAELRRMVADPGWCNVPLWAANATPKLLDELEATEADRDFYASETKSAADAWAAERERADSLAAQVVALRETISDWLADYSPSSEAMYRAKAVLADTAAVAAEWKRQERLAGAQEYHEQLWSNRDDSSTDILEAM